jgi:predicted oxidoreductase
MIDVGSKSYQADVVIIGGGLAGIVTAFQLLDAGLKVLILERDTKERFGGLARESFGGVTMINTPHQRRLGIRDSAELALADWLSFARFSNTDTWPRRWAEVYVNRSPELIYEWLVQRSVTFLPLVNWPERGLFRPGNSVPRWHIAWGTGLGMMAAILHHLDQHPHRQRLQIVFGHRVNRLELSNGRISGCAGVCEATGAEFTAAANQVVVAAGGICGGDLSRVRRHWYADWGEPPPGLLNGAHRYGDGLLHDCVASVGGHLTHLDKHWHYAAGIAHPHPDRERHGLSLVPPRSALWMNAGGERIGPLPLMGYTDTRYVVEQICRQPGQYSWLIMNFKIAAKELAVSGSDYMTAFREKSKLRLIRDLLLGNQELVNRLLDESADIVSAGSVPELAAEMNRLSDLHQVDPELLAAEIRAYDDQIDRGPRFFNDDQLRRIASFRTYRGDRIRTCKFQKIVDRKAMPLIAVRAQILSRKSLGGICTDLDCRVLRADDQVIPGLYAVGEAAGFGGGGIHGMGALEGTFLGSCVLTGRIAGAAITGRRI